MHTTLKHTAKHCNSLQLESCTREHLAGTALQHCNTLQHTATHCNTLQHTASGELHEGAPGGREDRAIESTNTGRVRAIWALYAHAVARHVDGVLCAVVAASRRLVAPIIHSIGIEIGDAIRHALHAAERIAIHIKLPVHATSE